MLILSIPSQTVKELSANSGIPYTYKRRCPTSTDILIRWGSTYSRIRANKTYNTIEAINNASNKPLARRLMREAGIDIPDDINDLASYNRFPCVGRPTQHAGGREFYYCQSQSDIDYAKSKGCTYFSKFYPKTAEYRVHVGSGQVLFISKKVDGDTSSYNWNHDKGFYFKVIKPAFYRPSVVNLAINAIEALGLDFGAVDIMADPTDDDLPISVVCEVNTTPALEGYSLSKYAEYFNTLRNYE